jgi:hypothetical protein
VVTGNLVSYGALDAALVIEKWTRASAFVSPQIERLDSIVGLSLLVLLFNST